MLALVNASASSARSWQVPRLDPRRRWLAGVAAALAVELGVETLWLRVAFVLLTSASGLGIAMYAASWLWLARHQRRLEGRPYRPVPKGASAAKAAVGVVSITLGLYLAAESALPAPEGDIAVWPVVISAFGMLLAWSSDRVDWAAPQEWLRAVGGLLLVAVGVVAFIGANLSSAATPAALWITLAVLSGVVLIVAPWLWRAASQVSSERLQRLRADERAEVAAHLHDSVLQTLSLIQRNADDRDATSRLARRQERELRNWLYGRKARAGEPRQFRDALTEVAAEVEEWHGLPIEVVAVGNATVDARVEAALAAAKEAMVNACKHSGAKRVDVFGEARERASGAADDLEIYVRDKGCGFDPSHVDADRRGIAESIRRRMLRAGGTVDISSSPGQGTEVSLRLSGSKEEAEPA